MARQFIYHMAGLNKAYGTKKVLENIHLSFYPDAKIGILGPNGAGKSTILKIMAGIDKEWSGEAWLAEGATVGYLAQEPALDPSKTVFENVMEGVAAKTAIIERYNELMMNYSDETADESAKLQDEMDRLNLWDLEQQVEMAMEALGCPPKEADVTKLSGGERRRVALCQLLLRQPDLLLLDEPTNHLDAETTAWLEKHLRAYPGRGDDHHPRSLLPRQMSPAGSWSSIAAVVFPMRATTPNISKPKPSGSSRKAARTTRASGRSAASASGSSPAQKPGRPSRKRASRRSRICWMRPTSGARPTRRLSFRMASGSAMW